MTDGFGRMCFDHVHGILAELPTYYRDDGETNEIHLTHYFSEYDE